LPLMRDLLATVKFKLRIGYESRDFV